MNVEPQVPLSLIGDEVVLDLATPYVILGKLVGEDHRYLILQDADVTVHTPLGSSEGPGWDLRWVVRDS